MALLPIDLLAEVVNKQFETQTETNEDQTEGSQTVVDTVADTEADQKAAANKEKEVHVRFAGDDPVPPPPEQGDEWGIHEQLDAICNKSLDPGIDGLARVLTAREWQRSCKETPASLLMEKMEQIDRQVARRKKEKARAFFNLQQQHSRTANWFSDPDPPQTEGRGDQRDPDQDALLKLFAWKVAENIGRRAFDLRPVRTGSKHEGIEHEKKVAVKNAESTMETEGGGDILSLCEALQDASASLEMLSVDDARREQMVDTFKRLVKEMDRQKSEMLHSLQDSAKQDDEYIRTLREASARKSIGRSSLGDDKPYDAERLFNIAEDVAYLKYRLLSNDKSAKTTKRPKEEEREMSKKEVLRQSLHVSVALCRHRMEAALESIFRASDEGLHESDALEERRLEMFRKAIRAAGDEKRGIPTDQEHLHLSSLSDESRRVMLETEHPWLKLPSESEHNGSIFRRSSAHTVPEGQRQIMGPKERTIEGLRNSHNKEKGGRGMWDSITGKNTATTPTDSASPQGLGGKKKGSEFGGGKWAPDDAMEKGQISLKAGRPSKIQIDNV